MRGHRDLRLACAAAVACAALALAIPIEALSLLFAAPLAFLLPGYAIVAAVFARKPLPGLQLAVLSIGLSLAVLALGALLLDLAPGGIRGFSWALLLALLTVAACRGAALRRPRAGTPRAFALPRPNRAQAALYGVAALVTIAALVLAFTTLPATKAFGHTEIWMQPYAATSENGVVIGVGSNEQEETEYTLLVGLKRGGAKITRSFALEPGESRVLRVPLSQPDAPQREVSAVLFRAQQPDRAYRRVSGWTPPNARAAR